MKVVVMFGSQRKGGTHGEIEKMVRELPLAHQYEFVHMAENRIEGCIACAGCAQTGRCILPASRQDQFPDLFARLLAADAIVVVSPVYAPIPSRLAAVLERLLSISYFSHEIGGLERPLKGKKTAIFCYSSAKIEDDTPIKLIFQRFLMDEYSFTTVDYPYLNQEQNPNEMYGHIIDYVKQVVLDLEDMTA